MQFYFLDVPKKSSLDGDSQRGANANTITECAGIWKTPRNCSPENKTCEYSVQWQYMPRKDEIRFTLTTKHTDTWTGIGFSNNEKMV